MKYITLLLLCFSISFSAFSQTPTIGLLQNDSLSQNGYTLFSNSVNTYLIDNCGFIVNTWQSDVVPGSSVYLLENGNLLRTGRIQGTFSGGGIGGRIELSDWDNNLLWSYDYADENMHQHHDIEPMPNGNILLIAWELKSFDETISTGRDPANTDASGIWPEQIVEIEMIGTDEINIVWEWHLWDHLIQDFDSSKDNFGVIADHPELLDVNVFTGNVPSATDWIHLNAVNYNPELDQIAMSSRKLSEIWIIDHSTTTEEAAGHTGGNSGKGGDFLYRWGNPQMYGQGSSDDQKLFGQHDIRWIPSGYPDEGMLMVYNNGVDRPDGNYSSVEKWMPPMDGTGQYTLAPGEAFGPTNASWIYTVDDFYSSRLSGAQPLLNGNTLICEGRSGHFFEVNFEEEILWEYINPIANGVPTSQGSPPPATNATFRTSRYLPDYAAFDGKDLIPGDPVEAEPYDSECVIYESPITSNNNLTTLENIFVHPNPISNLIVIDNTSGEEVDIKVLDLTGRLQMLKRSRNSSEFIATENWPQGFYFVHIFSLESEKSFMQKIVKL